MLHGLSVDRLENTVPCKLAAPGRLVRALWVSVARLRKSLDRVEDLVALDGQNDLNNGHLAERASEGFATEEPCNAL